MNGMPVIRGRDRRGFVLPRILHTVNLPTRIPQIKMKSIIWQSAADVT